MENQAPIKPGAEPSTESNTLKTLVDFQSRIKKSLKKYLVAILILFLVLIIATVSLYVYAISGSGEQVVQKDISDKIVVPTSTSSSLQTTESIFSGNIAYLKDNEIWVTDALSNKTPTGYFITGGVGGASDMGRSGKIFTSPDGKLVAFVNRQDNKLWILDVLTLEANMIYSASHLGYDNCPKSEVFLTDWSPDGQKLLYFVSHTGAFGMGWAGLSEKIPSCYQNKFGFYIADLPENTSYPVSDKWLGENDFYVLYLKGKEADSWYLHYYVDWLETGVVFERLGEGKEISKDSFIIIDPGTEERKVLIEDASLQKFTSLTFTSSGKRMAYLNPSETEGYYDYIVADGDNSNQKVFARGGWADYNFYGFSPDGRYLATRYKPGKDLSTSYLKIYDTQTDRFLTVLDEKGEGYYDFREWRDNDSFTFYKIGNQYEEGTFHRPKSLWLYSIITGEKHLLAEGVD